LEKKCNKHYIWFPEEDEWIPCTDEYFYSAKNKHDKLSPTCKKCEVKSSMKNKHENPERTLEHTRKQYKKRGKYFEQRNIEQREYLKNNLQRFYINNPDKSKQYSENHRIHDISTKEWNDCLKVFDYKCAYCGISQDDAKEKYGHQLHKEHKDYDGYNDLRNAVPACRRCNDKKLRKDMEVWFREQSFFSEERLQKIEWWCEEGYKDYIEEKPPYRISRRRIYDNGNKYKYIHELWSVDEKRNMVECILTGSTKKEIEEKLYILLNKVC
jgi:hypothetical protein